MWKIEKDNVAELPSFKLTFSDFMRREEMHEWVEASRKELQSAPKKFVVQVDMRGLKPLPSDAQEEMQVGQKLYKSSGMMRSAVLVDTAIVKMQFERIAKETGIYEWERYFSAEEPEFEASMERWLGAAQD